MNMLTSTMNKQAMMKTYNAALGLLITLLAMFFATAAHASLGGNSASVEADRLHMNASAAVYMPKTPSAGSYTVTETVLPSGTRVRQYVSAAGVVFGVAWSGPFMPDLRQLLGPSFDTMVARQASQSSAGHRHFGVHEPGLVIESGGHPRSFAGRAYLPASVPAGVNVQDIQ
jgi:hypothetical protein